jgi:hypothetical protein
LQKLLFAEIEYIRTVFWQYTSKDRYGEKQKHRVEYKVPYEWILSSTVSNGAGVGTLLEAPQLLQRKLPKFINKVHLSKTVRDYYGDQMTKDFWSKLHRLFPEMVEADPIHLAQVMHTYKADNIMGALPGFIHRSLYKKYTGQLARFITQIRDYGISNKGREVELLDQVTNQLIEQQAEMDMAKMHKHWFDVEIDLWHRGLNPFTIAEREIAKLPSKRKDVVAVWVEAISNICGVRKMDALGRLTIALGGRSSKGVPEMLGWFGDVMPEKLAYKALMGEIAFDNIVGGWVSAEVEQTIRNEAIWRVMEVLTSTRTGLTVKQVEDKESLQLGVHIYEKKCLEIINRNRFLSTHLRA